MNQAQKIALLKIARDLLAALPLLSVEPGNYRARIGKKPIQGVRLTVQKNTFLDTKLLKNAIDALAASNIAYFKNYSSWIILPGIQKRVSTPANAIKDILKKTDKRTDEIEGQEIQKEFNKGDIKKPTNSESKRYINKTKEMPPSISEFTLHGKVNNGIFIHFERG